MCKIIEPNLKFDSFMSNFMIDIEIIDNSSARNQLVVYSYILSETNIW